MSHSKRPPYILIKTWIEIYYSNLRPEHDKAQSVVEKLILKNFSSLYEAEMYLFQLEQFNSKRMNHCEYSHTANIEQ